MLEICSVKEEWMPKLFESYEKTGTLLPEVAKELGFPASCIVAAGAGDNAAAAVGTGCVGAGKCNLSLGTSGTIFITNSTYGVDPYNALHSFAHADGSFHLMGCMLSAASCNKWWMEEILKTNDFSGEQAPIDARAAEGKLGENHVYFLPYLMGERSPHNDPLAKGAFIGMSLDTSRADMLQAVFEGVAYALRDSLEVARRLGVAPERTTICGGGAKSPLWRKIVANIMNLKVDTVEVEEGPAYGGAILAAVACGTFKSVEEATKQIVRIRDTTVPEEALVAKYEKGYDSFVKLYPALKDVYQNLI
jgi:xylulokinase